MYYICGFEIGEKGKSANAYIIGILFLSYLESR
jgi:hypothetical protein